MDLQLTRQVPASWRLHLKALGLSVFYHIQLFLLGSRDQTHACGHFTDIATSQTKVWDFFSLKKKK